MDKIYKIFIDLLNEEIDNLNLGHPFNEDRLAQMKSLISVFTYLKYTVLNDLETMKLLQAYEHA